MVELSKLNDLLKDLRSKGYTPTKRATELVKLMGQDMSSHALMNGAITIRRNDDNTFDIMIGKEIIESSQKKLEESLAKRGYCLTLKGEKFVRRAYSDGSFCNSTLTKVMRGVRE